MTDDKNAILNIEIAENIKKQAEEILSEVGIPRSVAIDMFYRQIILNNGLPFEVKAPKRPLVREEMTKKEFDEMMMQGLMEMQIGSTVSIKEAYESLERGL